MRNRELLKAIERFVVCQKKYLLKNTSERWDDFSDAQIELSDLLNKVQMSEINEIFSDTTDYWDTLEVGK